MKLEALIPSLETKHLYSKIVLITNPFFKAFIFDLNTLLKFLSIFNS